MFKVLLCVPPDYDRSFPTLGIPVLLSFLKQKGVDVNQIDLNLRYRDFLANKINGSVLDINEKRFLLKPLLRKFFTENLQSRYYSDFLPREGDEVSPTLPYDNNTNSSFYFVERLLSSPSLDLYLEDSKENTFYQFYEEERILEWIVKEKIQLLGISLTSPSQVLAGLTLGRLIKKNMPFVHISIGGQWATLYRRELWQRKNFYNYFDSIIAFEGETSLYQLATCLKNKTDIGQIPNIILKDQPFNPQMTGYEEDINTLPCPDFDNLLLREYEGNQEAQICLTYETSRGCYWSKCAYCVDLPLPKPSYRRKDPSLVVKDLKQLKQKYKADYILLSDPGVSPRQMKEMAEKILTGGLEIEWWCMARLDEAFTYEIFQLARKAGLKKINFGFESANDHICQLLHKGNEKQRSERIIKECHQAGIEVDLQTMLGLPQETFNDGLETVEFLLNNKDYISRVTFNIYYLTPANFVYLHPEKYGIEFTPEPSLPFRFFLPFRNPQGMSKEEAFLLEKIYYSLREKKDSSDRRLSLEGRYSLPEGVLTKKAEFNLNQESTTLHYLHNVNNDSYLFLSNKDQEICETILSGALLENKNLLRQERVKELISEAEDKGFFVKK